jgi:type IV secretion system protein VirD4
MSIPSNPTGRLARVRYPWTLAWSVLTLLSALVFLFVRVWWLPLVPVAAAGLIWLWRFRLRPQTWVEAEKERNLQLRGGHATPFDMWWGMGYFWLRRKLTILRPSWAERPWSQKWRVPAAEMGDKLIRIRGWLGRRWLYAPNEWVVAIIAPPRMGKTSWLLNTVLDAVGACVVTSTKVETVEKTVYMRRFGAPLPWWKAAWRWIGRTVLRREYAVVQERPIFIFNPNRIGPAEYASNFKWNPLVGCEDFGEAQRRAGYFMSGATRGEGSGSTEFWTTQGVRILALYLHAAAIGGRTIQDVQRWINDRDAEGVQRQVRELLEEGSQAAVNEFNGWVDLNSNTATSTSSTIAPALQWLSTTAADLVGKDGDFDVDDFLDRRGTLYLLAEDREHGGVAPLFAAFTGYLLEHAKRRASKMPDNRLDPHLTFAGDEIPNICPLPLPRMTSDIGSHGIALRLAFQSKAQARMRWGNEGARVIFNNCAVQMILGGSSDSEDLDEVALLFGERKVLGSSPEGKPTWVKEPVLDVSKIRGLNKNTVLMVVPPSEVRGAVIGTIRAYYKRWDFKWALKQMRKDKRAARRAGQMHRPLGMLTRRPHEEYVVDGVPQQRPEAMVGADGTFDVTALLTSADQDDQKEPDREQ